LPAHPAPAVEVAPPADAAPPVEAVPVVEDAVVPLLAQVHVAPLEIPMDLPALIELPPPGECCADCHLPVAAHAPAASPAASEVSSQGPAPSLHDFRELLADYPDSPDCSEAGSEVCEDTLSLTPSDFEMLSDTEDFELSPSDYYLLMHNVD